MRDYKKYWVGGHWEKGKRIIPDHEALAVAELLHPVNIFTLLDLCCGDGNILETCYKYQQGRARCTGVDLYIEQFEDTPRLREMGFEMIEADLEEYIKEVPEEKFDYITMRNTFGTRHISHLNEQLEEWIFKSAHHFIGQIPPRPGVELGTFSDYFEPYHYLGKPAFIKGPSDFKLKPLAMNDFFYILKID